MLMPCPHRDDADSPGMECGKDAGWRYLRPRISAREAWYEWTACSGPDQLLSVGLQISWTMVEPVEAIL